MCEKKTNLVSLKKYYRLILFSAKKYCLFKKAFEVSLMILGMEEKTDELFKEESQRIKDVILFNNFYFAISGSESHDEWSHLMNKLLTQMIKNVE